jgi:Domain of unknown function (DUF4394)
LSGLIAWLALIGPASAEIFWGLTTAQTLVRFSSEAPGTTLATLPITGLPGGETLVGIEVFWPQGTFVGVSSAGRVYSLDRRTGAATRLFPAAAVLAPTGAAFALTDDGGGMQFVSDTGMHTYIDNVADGGDAGSADHHTALHHRHRRGEHAAGVHDRADG